MTYSVNAVQEQIKTQLSNLSPEHLQMVLEITTYLSEREKDEATQEIREIPQIMQRLEMAESQVKNEQLIDWEETKKLD